MGIETRPRHPEHGAGFWIGTVFVPAKPLRKRPLWRQAVREWLCRKAGGHWWHPCGSRSWFCCQCGIQGLPQTATGADLLIRREVAQ